MYHDWRSRGTASALRCTERESKPSRLNTTFLLSLSRALVQVATLKTPTARYAAVFDFFSLPAGVLELWRLAEIQTGKHRGSKASVIKVPHAQEILTFLNSRAVTLEATVTSAQRQFLGAGKKEEVLNQAAHLHLQLGNVERYCELKKELGEWERAIAMAPAVSLEFWAGMAKEYAQMLLAKNPSRLHDLLPWYVGISQPDTLVNLYINAEQYDDAVTLAQVSHRRDRSPCVKYPPRLSPYVWLALRSADGERISSECFERERGEGIGYGWFDRIKTSSAAVLGIPHGIHNLELRGATRPRSEALYPYLRTCHCGLRWCRCPHAADTPHWRPRGCGRVVAVAPP